MGFLRVCLAVTTVALALAVVRGPGKKHDGSTTIAVALPRNGAALRTNSGKGIVHTIRGFRGKAPRDPAVTLRRREMQD
jgi:hypothetical protein